MAATDATALRDGYPAWVAPLVAVLPVCFALLSVLDAGSSWPVLPIGVAIAIVPWLLGAVGRAPRHAVFAVWVVVPLAVINMFGEALGVDLSGESHTQFTLMILAWLVGHMAASAPLRVAAATTITATAVIVGRTVVEPSFRHSWMYWLGGIGIALVTGTMLRRQQQTLCELRQAQAALAADAAQRERQRIAREVHDVVGHTLTVTLMHLSAARRALDMDPGAARDALVEAETLARRSLADVRRTVGLLRADDDAPALQALPDASDIPVLVASYRSAGVELDVELDDDLAAVDPAVGLTLYRVVQESLSNAVSHAPGTAVELAVRVVGDRLDVRISNPMVTSGPTREGGLGIEGMGERVGLVGGQLRAGREDGRFVVAASIPTRAMQSSPEVTA